MSIGVLALIVSIFVFLLLVRNREPEPLELPSLGPTPQVLEDGSPDTEGLPTTLDDQGVLGVNIRTARWTGGIVSGAFGTGGNE